MAGRLHKPVNLLEVGGGRTDLNAGRADLYAGRADLDAGRPDLNADRADLDAGRPNLDAGRADLNAGRADLNAGRADLDAGRADLNAGRPDLETALRSNLASALSVALLGLPADFAERELYLAIASISYTGDLRCLKYRIRSFVVKGGGGRGDRSEKGQLFCDNYKLGRVGFKGNDASTCAYLLPWFIWKISCKKRIFYSFE